MEKFFSPRSIVVFGASATKMNLGQIVLLNNKQIGYEGNLYGVGSQEGDVNGIHIYTSVASLPETPDVAIFLTPAKTVPGLMRECGEKGITHVVIESGGFSEYSHGDHTLEYDVLAVAKKYNMKVIGPNCVGTVNFDMKMMMPFAFFKNIPTGGRLGLISQSGGVGGSYLRAVAGYGIKPGKFAATGNKLQLDEAHFLDYFIKDPKTDIIAMYLEGFKRGREFFDLARGCDKPIVIQKSNRSPISAKIAQSHTTALSSDDSVVDGAFRQAAIIRVDDELEFVNAIKVVRMPLMKERRVAVLSRSGGHAVLTADACAKYGFEMVPFPPSFIEKLKTIYKTRVIAHQNPLDLGEIFDYTIFTDILEEALKLENYDGVLFNHLYSSDFEGEMSRTFLAGVEKLVEKYAKPVCLTMISDREELLKIQQSQPFPIFTSPLEAATALHVSRTYHELKTLRDGRGKLPDYSLDLDMVKTIRSRCVHEQRIALTDEALTICASAGLQPVKDMLIKNEILPEKIPLHYPLAVKLVSRDASHKSDVGGVAVNIRNKKQLSETLVSMKDKIQKIANPPAIDGYLLQEMAPEGIECFVGGRRDPAFGPVIVAGLGGIFIEIFKDTSIRLAPVTPNEAANMMKELKAYPLLQGARGKKPADCQALVDIICRTSALLAACPDITEIDLNPVIVHPEGQGASIVDARIFFEEPTVT
ncbi:MAG: succinyl-CoA synthetase subunit alpha [Deltaproteobacteria bacterium ADurb.Bin151]|jgi:acetate---CoA ligase (ADP-forming)|nr:acetate--CoA ligase family protein [Smithella sp.]OQB55328.1 MAG: succinyl-CoA synthetase subunit alpha [Deltaproteobacteria bacterium ADurb.Bin151]HNZ10486.1 acetate--CoA ligase family protein [Smithellaceae bacterium]HOG81369.1 acetate--CoA ligase family protein [Smithellaceae bacterium]HOQ42447.1 acetate--CoA ligase family protein [Smithellaceae bacterium]